MNNISQFFHINIETTLHKVIYFQLHIAQNAT